MRKRASLAKSCRTVKRVPVVLAALDDAHLELWMLEDETQLKWGCLGTQVARGNRQQEHVRIHVLAEDWEIFTVRTAV